ncbi:MAG: phosphotransferase [Nitrospirae bacterium GWD2_57_9]|nr:MAG: phosphotransferase [Nitrospirae bacterium GWD2_57_9]
MIFEMHAHTEEHSACSHVKAADLVQRNFDKGLQGTVLTDHHYLWPQEEIRELRSRLKVPDHYLILAGQEVETPEIGHVLVYGAEAKIERGTGLAAIRARFPDAALVWAHPYRHEQIPPLENLLYLLIDGIEIFNSNHTIDENNRGLRDWHRYKFTALSGTDTHALSYTGLYPTIFDHPVATVIDLAAEIRAGRCRPFFEEIPRSGTSNTRVTEVGLGTRGGRTTAEQYVVRAHGDADTWRSASRTTRIIEEISRHGFSEGRFRVPRQLGSDEKNLIVIEQGIPGRSLFDALVHSGLHDARLYLRMAAEWLARLHNARLQVTPPGEYLRQEPNTLEHYLTAFYRTGNPHARRAQEIMDAVIGMETDLYCAQAGRMVQGHGDYHPKNIFIGRDRSEARATVFVAAVDFNSSYTMPQAFDVGTFLAQFRNQFYEHPEVLAKVAEEIFLETYLQHIEELDIDFLSQVELFRARTALSICYYLIKVGLGGSENLWRVLAEAGQVLTHLQVKSTGTAALIEQVGEERKKT